MDSKGTAFVVLINIRKEIESNEQSKEGGQPK